MLTASSMVSRVVPGISVTIARDCLSRQFMREEVAAALEKMGLPPTIRGEALSLEQFAELSLVLGQDEGV